MTKEELKTATTEKLISALVFCGRDSYYATYYDEVVNEITKRLKQIEQLKNQRQECERQYQEKVDDIIELQEKIDTMKELLNRYYMVCAEIPKEYRTMVFDSCMEDTRQLSNKGWLGI